MRPSACVTSTASRAGECFRTAATTSGSADPEAVEEADQRHRDEPRLRAEQRNEVFDAAVPRSGSARPSPSPGSLLEPRRRPGGEVEVVDDDLVARLQSQRQRREVVRLRRAGADADLAGVRP